MECMKNFIALFVLFLTWNLVNSQNLNDEISFEFGYTHHGSGDVTGFKFGTNYSRSFHKNFDLNIGFYGTINDSEEPVPLIFETTDGQLVNSTQHYVIGGMQLNLGIGFNLINTSKHKFGIKPDAILRYQATSIFDQQITDYPGLTGFPLPIRYLIREEPGRTLSLGGSVALLYQYKFNLKYFVGLNPGMQFDTNGDTIIFSTISIGRKF